MARGLGLMKALKTELLKVSIGLLDSVLSLYGHFDSLIAIFRLLLKTKIGLKLN